MDAAPATAYVETASGPPERCDVVVVGAGLVGLATARALLLARPALRVVVLEREWHVAAHQSGHNSGVIHAGVSYAPGSLKARLAVEGARALYGYCEERGIPHRRCGKLIVATAPRELPALEELERRGRANGVTGLARLDAAGIARIEPAAAGVAALHVPETGVVDFAAVARALAADVDAAGGTIVCGREVRALVRRGDVVELARARGDAPTRARLAIACAGAWADRLAPGADVRIVPFRGAYATLRPERAGLVRGLIYPLPDPRLPFLGVHLTRALDGSVHAGPTALLVGARDAYRLTRVVPADLAATLRWPGTWRMARRWWRTGAAELHRAVSRRALAAAAARLVPELRTEDLLPGGAGVRGQALARDGALVDDFLVADTATGVHVLNAPSPAATSALALGELIAERALRRLG